MNLFIDTNIFLSFYHFTSDDLDGLKKLNQLIKQKHISLHLPFQVIDEFERNRENKIRDALKRLRTQKLNLKFPQICQDYEEYEELRECQRKYESLLSQILEKLDENISKETLKADITVTNLFENANKIDISDDIIDYAKLRMEIGNPPGKDGSFGDAIIWETLISIIPDGEDLHFVTDDGDYSSSLNSKKFNEFLYKEWSREKSSDLKYYHNLSSFFKKNGIEISLSSEENEKDRLIRSLANSPSFHSTHKIIGQLFNYSNFSQFQINELVSAALNNSQVRMIIRDEDLKKFYLFLVNEHEDMIEEELLIEIKKLLPDDPNSGKAEAASIKDW